MEDAYCSDPELDQNELEVALYSQVHFDPGPGSESWIRDASISNSHRPFFIEVKNLTAKISTIKSSQPIATGDFLAFSENSSSKIDDTFSNKTTNNQKKNINKSKSSKILDQKESLISQNVNFIIDKKGGQKSDIDSSSVENVSKNSSDKLSESASNKKKSKKSNTLLKGGTRDSNSQIDLPHKTETAKNITSKKDVSDLVEKLNTDAPVSNEPVGRKSKVKDGVKTSKAVEKILPFAVTKTRRTASDENEELLGVNSQISESHDALGNVNQPKENLQKLEDFLHLSETGTSSSKVKKKVNKLDEAVRIRKPPVYVRRPPVVVKYKQDSDTNTDYSDSDCSSHASLMIASKKKLPVGKVLSVTNASSDQLRCNDNNLDSEIEILPHTEEIVSVKESDECIVLTDDVSGDDVDLVEISEEINPPHNEVESLGSSDQNETSSEADVSLEINPNLEFNLEGGMSALLTTRKNFAGGEWKIDEQDRFKINCIMSRYFSPLTVQCRNCRKEGHLSRDCPEPLKKKCAYCAEVGHVYQICPNTVCFNCDTPGHRNTNCMEPKRRWRIPCERCNVNGHSQEVCPDKWRQYHLSVDTNKLITQSRSAINSRVYCYNCASEGHFGHDCRKPRMNPHVPASYTLIAHYDTDGKKIHHRKKSSRKEKKNSSHNLKRKHSHVEADDDGVKKQKRSEGKKREHCKRKPKGTLFPTTFKPQPNQQSSHWSSDTHPLSQQYYLNHDNSRRHQYGNLSNDQADLREDFEAHQVNNNEWWNASDEPSARKRRRKENEVHKANSFNEDEHWSNQVYVENPGRRQQNHNWDRGNWDQLGSRHNINNTYVRGNPGRYLEMDNVYLNESRRDFRQEPHMERMKHSQSWPNVMKSKKNYGGFQFQNAQFEVMKRNCDRDRHQMGNIQELVDHNHVKQKGRHYLGKHYIGNKFIIWYILFVTLIVFSCVFTQLVQRQRTRF
ncbi:hypothetical protein Btru_035589 [Bulinus truncatus]|nr:hypothetical protein Btru_035589 [Bulinus truncatus]